jgi:hydroxymethylbilane synthase
LAQAQSNLVRQQLLATWGELEVAIQFMDTQGDLNRRDPLPAIGGKGLFTQELEEALRQGHIDVAVHSLKDLPIEDSPGLTVIAIPERAAVNDILLSHRAARLEELPAGAVVGTSSLRRTAQLLALRPDLRIKDIRGNVDTRLRKLDDPNQGYDALVLAQAGLDRLGYQQLGHAHPIPADIILPAPGQGALAVQGRVNDPAISSILKPLDHAATRAAVTAERAFLNGLGGGCALPVAALATVEGNQLKLRALVASPGGERVIRVSDCASIETAETLGRQLAERALGQGAKTLLNG